MKNMKKITALVLALVMVLSALAGCGRSSESDDAAAKKEEAAKGKTVITVGNFYAGFKDYWLTAAIERFEEMYADVSFEEGKKGVYVDVSNSTAYSGNKLISSIRNSGIDLYFTESVYYYDFVNQGLFADITDVVTETLSDYGETESIEDKLSDTYKDFLNSDGSYYALPFYEAYYPITYDKDLFDECGLYMMADNRSFLGQQSGYDGVLTDEWKAQLGTGPDGKAGTYDDGFPRTYDEFFALCDYMVDIHGVTPFCWTGTYQEYVTDFAAALACDAEGEEFLLNWTLSGTATGLVDSVDSNGNVTLKGDTEISESNSTLLAQQAGKYYALSFIETIVENSKYHTEASLGSSSQYDSQYEFLAGKVYQGLPKVAMLIDGSWWENEASSAYEELSAIDPDQARSERNIGIMPMPKPTEAYLGDASMLCTKYALCFVNADSTGAQLEVAKLFLQFCHTDESLAEFTQIAGTPKPYEYEMTAEQLAECSAYGASAYYMHSNANVIYPVSKADKYILAPSAFNTLSLFSTTVSQGSFSTPSTAFNTYPSLSALDYFNGLTWAK